MKEDFGELKSIGDPLKELTKSPDSGFAEISSLRDIFKPLKELENIDFGAGLNALKDEFEPLKPDSGHIDSEQNDSKEVNAQNQDNSNQQNMQQVQVSDEK